jgi:hypothetical protein
MSFPSSTDASTAAEVRHFAAERDIPCPGCGYNLRGINSNRCPECNEPLALRLTLAEPALGRYIAVMVVLSLSLGAHTLLSLVATFSFLFRAGPNFRWPPIWFYVLQYGTPMILAAAIAALSTKRGRSWFRNARTWISIAIPSGGFVLAAASIIAMMIWN